MIQLTKGKRYWHKQLPRYVFFTGFILHKTEGEILLTYEFTDRNNTKIECRKEDVEKWMVEA